MLDKIYEVQYHIENKDQSDLKMEKERKDNLSTMDNITDLFERYTSLVKYVLSRYSVSSRYYEDVLQEGNLALLDAVRSFDETKGIAFETYAFICVSRRVHRAISTFQAKKHQLLSTALPLEEESFVHQVALSPEQILLEKESIHRLWNNINTLLSPLERKVLCLYLQGESYKAIANILQVKVKTVENALLRVRQKLRAKVK